MLHLLEDKTHFVSTIVIVTAVFALKLGEINEHI